MASTEDDPRAKAQGKILAAFQKKYPKITVKEVVVPWEQLAQQLLQAAAAGKAPDVSRQLDARVAELARAGVLESLDPFVADWSSDDWDDLIYPREDNEVDGTTFSLRQQLRIGNLTFYRKDLWDAAGVDVVPSNLTDFAAAAKSAVSGNQVGFLIPFGQGDNLSRFMQTCPPLWWAEGSSLIDPETEAPKFQESVGVEIFQWLQDALYKDHLMTKAATTMDSEAANQMMDAGTLGSTWHQSIQLVEWASLADAGKLATGYQPTLSGSVPPANTSAAWTFTMPKGAQKDEAWLLIDFLQSAEAQEIEFKASSDMPTRKSALAGGLMDGDKFALQRSWLEYIDKTAVPDDSLHAKGRPQMITALSQAAQEILAQQKDVSEALERAAESYDNARPK
jgi:ABC-type glycerol-3-phosphate transport system substrate-binding protein